MGKKYCKGVILFVFFAVMIFGIQNVYADNVDDAREAVTAAQTALDDAKTALTDAETAVAAAQEALEKAQADLASAEAALAEEIAAAEAEPETGDGLAVAEDETAADETASDEAEAGTPLAEGVSPLPATYTVRAWDSDKDCFWTIAEYPFVYNDPFQWRKLYDANKSKLPDPENPNDLEVGTVLSIPGIRGETREGDWDSAKTYAPLP